MANLYTLIKAKEKQVRKIAKKELTANGYDVIVADDFIYAEGTVPVLLVAHYDTVLQEPPKYIRNIGGVLSGKRGLGADDRAGIYAILEIVKKHHVHVLFTGGEERGCIGAEAFTRSGIKPEVNYIIELDRRGENDAVYYEGDNQEFEDFITEHGWKTASGTFTDICVVAPHIGVAAVNLSIGYENEHKEIETLNTEVMNRNIQRVQELFEGPKFEWKELPYTPWYRRDYGSKYSYYEDYGWGEDYWEIDFADPTEAEDQADYVWAMSYEEAAGAFLMEHPDLCFNDILAIRCYGK